MSYVGMGQTAEKGGIAAAAAMADCIARGGEWTGSSCFIGSTGGGGGGVTMQVTPTKKSAMPLLAGIGAVALIGGAYWWARKKK